MENKDFLLLYNSTNMFPAEAFYAVVMVDCMILFIGGHLKDVDMYNKLENKSEFIYHLINDNIFAEQNLIFTNKYEEITAEITAKSAAGSLILSNPYLFKEEISITRFMDSGLVPSNLVKQKIREYKLNKLI